MSIARTLVEATVNGIRSDALILKYSYVCLVYRLIHIYNLFCSVLAVMFALVLLHELQFKAAEFFVFSFAIQNLPSDFVREHLPKNTTKLTMLDPTGRSWPITYVCYNGRHGALSGGWGKASVANNLEIHDAVVFELVKKHQLNMHIYRVVEEITPFRRGCEVERESERTH